MDNDNMDETQKQDVFALGNGESRTKFDLEQY